MATVYMLIRMLICLVFLIAINITDHKRYKIKNRDILITLLAGLVLGAISHTFGGSICGMLLPLVLFPLFAVKMLGAGDVKALCAIGAVVGFKMSAMTLILSFISGGIIALGFMLINKNFIARIKYLIQYLKKCFIMRKLEKYNFGGDGKSHFRFSYAITAGTVLAFVNYYFGFI